MKSSTVTQSVRGFIIDVVAELVCDDVNVEVPVDVAEDVGVLVGEVVVLALLSSLKGGCVVFCGENTWLR